MSHCESSSKLIVKWVLWVLLSLNSCAINLEDIRKLFSIVDNWSNVQLYCFGSGEVHVFKDGHHVIPSSRMKASSTLLPGTIKVLFCHRYTCRGPIFDLIRCWASTLELVTTNSCKVIQWSTCPCHRMWLTGSGCSSTTGQESDWDPFVEVWLLLSYYICTTGLLTDCSVL